MDDDIKTIAEYEEIERLIPSRVKEVRGILQDKYGIVVPEKCEEFLKRCARVKDGNLEKTIKLVKAFHSVIPDLQNWDAVFDPIMYRSFFEDGVIMELPKRDKLGRRIFVLRAKLWDVQKMNFDEMAASLFMYCQYANATFADVQTMGFVTVWDCKGFTLQHAWAVKQWRLMSIMKIIQNGVGGRVKAFHFINHPKIVAAIYGGVKPFLKEKLKRRILFHPNAESLYKHVDPECLPECIGGTLDDGECIDKAFVKNFIGTESYFSEMIKLGFPPK